MTYVVITGDISGAKAVYADFLGDPEVKSDKTCGWICAIRFARRTEGVNGAREQFMCARKV